MSESRPESGSVTQSFYCGIDLHGRTATLFVCDQSLAKLLCTTVAADPGAVVAALERFRPHLAAGVEATTGANDLADDLEDAGIPCLVADPVRLRAMIGRRPKSDRGDAEMLAHLLVVRTLPVVYRPPAEVRQLREWLRQRASLVASRQRIRARRTQRNPCRHGSPPVGLSPVVPKDPRIGGKSRIIPTAELGAACDAAADDGLSMPIDELERTAVGTVERLFSDVFTRLTAIPGVGRLTGAALCVEIGHIDRFGRVEHMLSYAGLVKKLDRSGGRVVGRASWKSNTHLRAAFFAAAHSAGEHCPAAREWLARHYPAESQQGSGQVALARRLAGAVYVIWRTGVPFDPARAFPSFVEGVAM